MKNHKKPSHLHRSRSKPSLTLRHKMQLAQHAGARIRGEEPTITLPKAPWEKDECHEQQS